MENYLGRYDEKQSRQLAQQIQPLFAGQGFDFVLVIPAYRESSDFLDRLKSGLLQNNSVLLILVINQPKDDSDEEENRTLQNHIKTNSDPLADCDEFHISQTKDSAIITLDFFSDSRKLSPKEGVGAARKIGSDLACHLIASGLIQHSWIFNTDADTLLPSDYFTAAKKSFAENTSALLYPFRHISCGNKEIDRATRVYEQSLNYYVDGLQWAGSPYAFHTVGSCIAVNAKHYSQARGYPKRAAGEDFYLLNKLAKLGEINTLAITIEIESRHSNRAPFGTGPAVKKIINEKEYLDYNPKIFIELKRVLQHSHQLFNYKGKTEEWLSKLPEESQKALIRNKIDIFFIHMNQQIKREKDCLKQWHEWFDGFRTLKFIHSLEDSFPKAPLSKSNPFLPGLHSAY